MEKNLEKYLNDKNCEDLVYNMKLLGYKFVLKDKFNIKNPQLTLRNIRDRKVTNQKFKEDIAPYKAQIKKYKPQIIKALLQQNYDDYIKEKREESKFEPRPDLVEDTMTWQKVLKKAYKNNKRIYGLLHFARIEGTKLKKDNNNINMSPQLGKPGRWQDEDEWLEFYELNILPNKDEIQEIIRAV